MTEHRGKLPQDEKQIESDKCHLLGGEHVLPIVWSNRLMWDWLSMVLEMFDPLRMQSGPACVGDILTVGKIENTRNLAI